jgi:hypothetical protein
MTEVTSFLQLQVVLITFINIIRVGLAEIISTHVYNLVIT